MTAGIAPHRQANRFAQAVGGFRARAGRGRWIWIEWGLVAWLGCVGVAKAQTPTWPEPTKGFGAHPLATRCDLTAEGPRLMVKGEFDAKGSIDSLGSAGRFKRAFDQCIDRGDGRTIQVWFWSPGGSVVDGIEVGRTLADAGDRVTTYVPAGKQCVSICTIAFLGGSARRRFVHPSAQYVVHSFGDLSWSQAFAEKVFDTLIQAQDFIRCFDASDKKGPCEKANPPDSLATDVISMVAKRMTEKGMSVRPLATVCASPAVLEVYKQVPISDAEAFAKKPCSFQMAVTSKILQSTAVDAQRGNAQATRLLYQFLTSPPKGVHVERLLDRWFSVTINNTVPLTRSEIAEIGVAGILDLEQSGTSR